MVAIEPLGARQSHASSLLIVGETVLVAWFAGTHEGAMDTRIHVARGDRDGQFDVPRIVADAPCPHWNPVLAEGPDGRVWLFFRRGPRIDTWTTWICHSTDAGATWSDAVPLVEGDTKGGRGPVRQAPLRHRDVWVAPGSVEVWEPEATWDCFVDLTVDGTAWDRVHIPLDHHDLRGAGCIQPSLVLGGAGQLIVLTRSTTGRAHRSATADPRRWPPLSPCGLPNNNSGLAAVTLPDRRLAAVHNPATDDWGARCPLVVSVSDDDGLTWAQAGFLEDGSRFPGAPSLRDDPEPGKDGRPLGAAASGVVTTGDAEFSYPSAAVVDDELWVTYTWQRRGIALARVTVTQLHAGTSPDASGLEA
ncbi:exo-alpha-sialidase [Mariniluteicoccus flavus]